MPSITGATSDGDFIGLVKNEEDEQVTPLAPMRRRTRTSVFRAPRITHHKGVSWETDMEKTVITRIDGKIYDFSDFVDIHPGGHDAIRSCNMRDSSTTFFHTHSRDKNVKMLIKKHQVRDEGKIKRAEEDIPILPKVDQRLMELNRKYDGKQFVNVTWYFVRPFLAMALGVYLLQSTPEMTFTLPSMTDWTFSMNVSNAVSISSRQAWWIGIASWAYAIFKAADLSHQMSHNSLFKDPQNNRFANDYYTMLVMGFSGRLAFREHPEHHWSSNIIGMDPALSMPIEWREEAPLDSDALGIKGTDVGRGFFILSASILAFPWNTVWTTVEGMQSKLRLNKLSLCLCWVLRTSLLLYLVGPIGMIVSYNIAMALVALEATTQHFDQPVMMPEEFYKAKMSFAEHTIRSVQSWYEPLLCPFPVVAVDHIYHHLIPSIVDSRIPQYIKDEIDQIILEELGVKIVQRSLLTCFVETYLQYFGVAEPSRMKGYVSTKDGVDPFKPIGMSTAEFRRRSRLSTKNNRMSICKIKLGV